MANTCRRLWSEDQLGQGGGGGGTKLYRHKVVSDGKKYEIVNFSSTVLTPENMSDELRKGYCYIRYFYRDDSNRDMASDCVVGYDDSYAEGSWQDRAITLHYLDKPSSGSAEWSTTYLINPGITTITDTVTEVQ